MIKNKCQFCGIKHTKIAEKWIKHEHFGLICPDCIKGDFVIMLLNKYLKKQRLKNINKRIIQ